jgi:hypothetical protein
MRKQRARTLTSNEATEMTGKHHFQRLKELSGQYQEIVKNHVVT